MVDKNNIELKIGQIVKIEGGFFKNDNGLFRIQHAPGNEDWNGEYFSLKKIKKNFEDAENKYNLSSWPLFPTCNNRNKNIEACEHNKINSKIEIIGNIRMHKIKISSKFHGITRSNVEYVTEKKLKELQETEYITNIEILEII